MQGPSRKLDFTGGGCQSAAATRGTLPQNHVRRGHLYTTLGGNQREAALALFDSVEPGFFSKRIGLGQWMHVGFCVRSE
jgi:hypothetical protein